MSSNNILYHVLNLAHPEEKLAIVKALFPDERYPSTDVHKIYSEIRSVGSHTFSWENKNYLELLTSCCAEIKISTHGEPTATADAVIFLENKLLEFVLNRTLENMTPEQKVAFNQEVISLSKKHENYSGVKVAGATTAMVGAQLGGFGTYMLLSSSLSTLSMGTLSIGAYMGASSMLSVALGPVGWVGLGIYSLYKLGAPNYEKLIPAIMQVSLAHQRINYEHSTFEQALNLRITYATRILETLNSATHQLRV